MNSHVIIPGCHDLTLVVVETGRRNHRVNIDSSIIAEIGKEIIFDPDVLNTYNYDGWSPIHYDLLILCAAIEYADRRTGRRIDRWARDFSITVPVVEISVWQRRELQVSLQAVLRQLTGDNWKFSFVPWQGCSVLGARQRSLQFATERSFVIAYSDGLDSRCVPKVLGNESGAVCVRVTKHRHSLKAGDEPFDQLPFRVNVSSARESTVRSRGFKFAAVTAIAAQLTGLTRIVVPESGQGALGPVLRPLHNVYADYRNHPTYFRKMELFIKEALGHDVLYDQPRLWSTKGQTVSAYLRATNGALDELFDTRSCWQQRWNARIDGKLRQCGLCAACLLRRMSMHAAEIEEPEHTYVIADLTVSTFKDALPGRKKVRLSKTMAEYGSVGARHLQQLADLADLPDTDLKFHAFDIARAMGQPQDYVLKKLRNMLLTHAKEWRAFMAAQGEQSFLKNWIQGGRYG